MENYKLVILTTLIVLVLISKYVNTFIDFVNFWIHQTLNWSNVNLSMLYALITI